MKTGVHQKYRLAQGFPSGSSAFTIIELLLVIAIIAVLVSLLMPAISKARMHAVDLQCRNQIRQLMLAWHLYADDNDGRVAPNRLNSVGSWVGGIMGFDVLDTDSTNIHKLVDPRWAKLGPYVRAAKVFKCASDRSNVNYGWTANPRVRSYSMNGAVGFQLGDAPLKHSQGWKTYKRSSDMTSPGPSQLWVLTEEHPDGIGDCVFSVDLEERGARARFISVPAHYHNAAANFSFADGHVERHRWLE